MFTTATSDNDAQFGGGVYVTEDCAGFIEETDFQGNYATDEGGGICVVDANFFVINYCSITENKSQLGGGIFAMSSPKLYIMDCNIAEHST